MKLRNTKLNSSLISKLQSYRLDKLFIVFLLSLSIVACDDDNGSSNVSSSTDCSGEFGDQARCDTRDGL